MHAQSGVQLNIGLGDSLLNKREILLDYFIMFIIFVCSLTMNS